MKFTHRQVAHAERWGIIALIFVTIDTITRNDLAAGFAGISVLFILYYLFYPKIESWWLRRKYPKCVMCSEPTATRDRGTMEPLCPPCNENWEGS